MTSAVPSCVLERFFTDQNNPSRVSGLPVAGNFCIMKRWPTSKPVNQKLPVRKRVEEEAAKLQDSAAEAAQVLTKDVGVSMRDAGELLKSMLQRGRQSEAASFNPKTSRTAFDHG